MKRGGKTNAIRYLEKLGIPHETLAYDMKGDDLSACHVAEASGIPIDLEC